MVVSGLRVGQRYDLASAHYFSLRLLHISSAYKVIAIIKELDRFKNVNLPRMFEHMVRFLSTAFCGIFLLHQSGA